MRNVNMLRSEYWQKSNISSSNSSPNENPWSARLRDLEVAASCKANSTPASKPCCKKETRLFGVAVARPDERKKPTVLTIAGSDSSGGAGLQADLRVFAAFGLHGLSTITAVTAQNSTSVRAVHAVPAAHVRAQIQVLFAEFEIAAVKIGMLGNAAAIGAVVDCLRALDAKNIVLDPVLASSSGTALLTPPGIQRLRTSLIPLVALLTPNVPEAEVLLDRRLRTPRQLRIAAHDLRDLGARAVLLKGGHVRGPIVQDILVDDRSEIVLSHPRQPRSARGTGCSLAAAITAGLAVGLPLRAAVENAERFLQEALRRAYRTGSMNVLNAAPRNVAQNSDS